LNSFEVVENWLKDIRTYSNPDVKLFLIGNKVDLEDKYE
jgi:GTPase SAR1 family protein